MKSETGANSRRLYVSVGDEALREALGRRIERTVGFAVHLGRPGEGTDNGSVLLTTTADISNVEAAILARAGVVPVVLAALPSQYQREQYEGADAIYLPMDLDTEPLLRVLHELLDGKRSSQAVGLGLDLTADEPVDEATASQDLR